MQFYVSTGDGNGEDPYNMKSVPCEKCAVVQHTVFKTYL